MKQMYKSVNEIGLRVEVLRDGGVYAILEPYSAPQVQMTADSELCMSMKGDFLMPEKDIIWLKDRIRPVLIINGKEYPVGMFVGTTPKRAWKSGVQVLSLESYSVLFLAQRVSIPSGYIIPAGTNYLGAVQDLLRISGIDMYITEGTEKVTPTDRADWSAGTSVLSVINELLSEINFRSAWVNLDGVVMLTKAGEVSANTVSHSYMEGEYSIIGGEPAVSTDYFDKANVFRAICSNPDLPAPLVAEVVNDDPGNPMSTAVLGIRIVETQEVNSVADFEELQEIASNMRRRALETTETIEYVTALVPVVNAFDVVALDVSGESGIWVEVGWTMTLDASGEMRHKAERVVI